MPFIKTCYIGSRMTCEQFLLNHDFPSGSVPLFERVSLDDNGSVEPLFDLRNEEGENFFRASVISGFERRLELIFETGSRNNVCLANHEEVRPDFRTSFSQVELLEYIFAGLPEMDHWEKTEVERIILAYPTDADEFWKMAAQGKKKQQQQ